MDVLSEMRAYMKTKQFVCEQTHGPVQASSPPALAIEFADGSSARVLVFGDISKAPLEAVLDNFRDEAGPIYCVVLIADAVIKSAPPNAEFKPGDITREHFEVPDANTTEALVAHYVDANGGWTVYFASYGYDDRGVPVFGTPVEALLHSVGPITTTLRKALGHEV